MAAAKAIALIGVVSLLGCGDDTANGKMTGAGPPQSTRKPKAAPVATVEVKRLPNAKWDAIRPFFDKFVNQPLLTHKDTFRDNLVKHVPKVDLPVPEPESAPTEEIQVPIAEDVASGPLERYGASEYRLVMIMSGTVVPKAVVLDPIGNAWIVQKDARFGNKSGIVQNITQYSMIIQEPDQDKPLEKTIKPPIFELASDFTSVLSSDEQRLTGRSVP